MSFTSILASFPIGILEAEVVLRVMHCKWLHVKYDQLKNLLPTFIQTRGDEARQALMLRAGDATLQFGLVMLCTVAVISMIAYIPSWAFAWDKKSNLIYLLLLSAVATVWVIFRQRRHQAVPTHSKHEYGLLERCLHRIALELRFVREISFDLEKLFFLPQKTSSRCNEGFALPSSDRPVYVCGMARSGTTFLFHILEELSVFRSLTYRNMPFVLAPNLWNALTNGFHVTKEKKERGHNDGVMIGFDTPEAFEEVFWQTYLNYKKNHGLMIERPSTEVLEKFSDYRAIVANQRSSSGAPIPQRYLSKNNNNLVRLSELGDDPAATILLVYRDPVAMARSLLRQHLIFSAMHEQDNFSYKYMTWLAHHEFGLGHLPFFFALPEMDTILKPDSLNYWLNYWDAVHRYLLAQSTSRFYLISYDALCRSPESMLQSIFTVIGVDGDVGLLVKKINAPRPASDNDDEFDSELLMRARITYNDLCNCSKNIGACTLKAQT